MKGSKLFKKAAAAFFAASFCMSFAAVANAEDDAKTNAYSNNVTYDETIQFSPYGIWEGTETRVKNPSFDASRTNTYAVTLDKNKTPDWKAGTLGWSGAGRAEDAYNLVVFQHNGTYKVMDIDVKIEDVPAGLYTIEQYTPYKSNAYTINIKSDSGETQLSVPEETKTDATVGAGTWRNIGTVYVSGNTTFTYYCDTTITNISTRVGQTRLVKQTPEAIEQKADLVEDINDNGDGASVWEATVEFDGDHSYTTLGVSAKLNDSDEVKEGTAVEMPTISGKSSVYAVIAVNKLSTELDWVKVTVE